MATTFYMEKDNTNSTKLKASLTPTDSTWWNARQSGFYTARANQTRQKGVSGSTTISGSIPLSNDYLYGSFYSELLNGTSAITGTISMAIQQHSSVFTNSINMELIVRTIDGTNGTVKGTNLAHTVGTFFAGTTFNSNYISAATLTSVTPAVGDFLWFEVGLQESAGSGESGFLMFRDDNATTDLPIGSQSTTTTNNPSIIFNTTIAAGFQSGVWPETGGLPNSLMMLGCGT